MSLYEGNSTEDVRINFSYMLIKRNGESRKINAEKITKAS